jgi:hypothetical protein
LEGLAVSLRIYSAYTKRRQTPQQNIDPHHMMHVVTGQHQESQTCINPHQLTQTSIKQATRMTLLILQRLLKSPLDKVVVEPADQASFSVKCRPLFATKSSQNQFWEFFFAT